MGRRIGLIQSAGIGDIIIALPIAQEFLERGDSVYWPIERHLVPAFHAAEPDIHFIPIDRDDGFAYATPKQILTESGCDQIICLLNFLERSDVAHPGLARSLKFDEYKYAIAGVRFSRKWELRLRRNLDREQALARRLNLHAPYVCAHLSGAKFTLDTPVPPQWIANRQLVRIEPIKDNPFDWISTIEDADELLMIDSCFANLTEQLNLPNKKHFVLKWPATATPVMKNGWIFAGVP